MVKQTNLSILWNVGAVFSTVWLFATVWTVARQAPLSMGFPRQEFWSGLSFPSPGGLADPGTEPGSPALQAGSSSLSPQEGPQQYKGNNYWHTATWMRPRRITLSLKSQLRSVTGAVSFVLFLKYRI